MFAYTDHPQRIGLIDRIGLTKPLLSLASYIKVILISSWLYFQNIHYKHYYFHFSVQHNHFIPLLAQQCLYRTPSTSPHYLHCSYSDTLKGKLVLFLFILLLFHYTRSKFQNLYTAYNSPCYLMPQVQPLSTSASVHFENSANPQSF